jgi:hypothetical protein
VLGGVLLPALHCACVCVRVSSACAGGGLLDDTSKSTLAINLVAGSVFEFGIREPRQTESDDEKED